MVIGYYLPQLYAYFAIIAKKQRKKSNHYRKE